MSREQTRITEHETLKNRKKRTASSNIETTTGHQEHNHSVRPGSVAQYFQFILWCLFNDCVIILLSLVVSLLCVLVSCISLSCPLCPCPRPSNLSLSLCSVSPRLSRLLFLVRHLSSSSCLRLLLFPFDFEESGVPCSVRLLPLWRSGSFVSAVFVSPHVPWVSALHVSGFLHVPVQAVFMS